MRYCADTWFLLKLFGRDSNAKRILEETELGKDFLFISIITYSETIKKLIQQGTTNAQISDFFELLRRTNKVMFMSPDFLIGEEAAKVSLSFGVPLIDSFVAATAKTAQCDVLLAKDSDFKTLEKRKYLKVQSW